MIAPVSTPADLAEIFGTTEAKVLEWRRHYRWPSMKVGRTIRFTAEQVEQIIASHSVAPEQEQVESVVAISGQTKRSAARSA